jgi:hypothetical protein
MQQRNWRAICGTAGLALLAACNNDPASQQAPDTARTVANDVVEDLTGTSNNLATENVTVPSDKAVGATGGHSAHQRPEPAQQPRSQSATKPDGKTKPVEHPPSHDMGNMQN